jgi:hypothetical protein
MILRPKHLFAINSKGISEAVNVVKLDGFAALAFGNLADGNVI